MNKKGKKVLRAVIIIVSVAVVVAGIVLALSIVKKKNQNKKEAMVVSVSSISDDPSYYGSNSKTYEGSVTVSTTQKVYVTSTTSIAELYVSEGQSVKAGDLILKYDTTAQQLQLDIKKASVDTANNNVTSLQRDLKKLQETVPVEDMPQATTETTEAVVSDPLATDSDAQPEEPVYDDSQNIDSGNDDQLSNTGVTYTRAELAEAIKNKETEIRDAKLNAELEEISYEIMLAQNESPELYCNFDGVVTSIIDMDTAIDENKPYITISGNEGMTVQAYVGEYSLANISLGDSMSLYCYDNGMTYTGTVTDIGVVPNESYSSYGAAESYYPVEISVPDAGDLTQGMYLEVSTADDYSWDDYGYDEDYSEDEVSDGSDEDVFTIPLQFVRKEDGQRYVMKDVDGKLVKTYVSTGKIYWGYEIEITGGLSQSDYIAFPYLEDSVEGVRTKKSTIDELYGY
jgi:multidrug efflux pump subunit AcrA (membrane-fusion protein)